MLDFTISFQSVGIFLLFVLVMTLGIYIILAIRNFNKTLKNINKVIETNEQNIEKTISSLPIIVDNVENITNTIDKFKKSNNRVAHRFISLSLQHYVNTHRIGRRLREKLFNALDIDYRPNPLRLES